MPAQMIRQLSADDAIVPAAEGELLLIDVREAGELAQTGRAAGAVHIPLGTLAMRADPTSAACHPALKEGKPIAIYCAAGARAQKAAEILVEFGYSDVSNLGRIADWAAAGGPIERE